MSTTSWLLEKRVALKANHLEQRAK